MALCIEDLRTLRQSLHPVHRKWYDIGLELSIHPDSLDNIARNVGSDTSNGLLEMLKKWLRKVNPVPTWESIITALEQCTVGEEHLASQLKEKYCNQQPSRKDVCQPVVSPVSSSDARLHPQEEQKMKTDKHTRPKCKQSFDDRTDISPCEKDTEIDCLAKCHVVISGSSALSIKISDLGLKIHIPEGALPPRQSDTKLTIKVSLSGQYDTGESYELASAVYWVDSPVDFQKPVTIEMQHSAVYNDPKQPPPKFATAPTSPDEPTHFFNPVDEGKFSTSSDYGTIHTMKFSGWAIVVPRGTPQLYCSQLWYSQCQTLQPLVYSSSPMSVLKVFFSITRALDAVAYAMGLSLDDVVPCPARPVDFEDREILMDITPGPAGSKQGEMEIVPCYPPVIRKDEVDSFGHGRVCPVCELTVRKKLLADYEQCRIDLIGAKAPHNYVILDLERAVRKSELIHVREHQRLFQQITASRELEQPIEEQTTSKGSSLEQFSDSREQVQNKASWLDISKETVEQEQQFPYSQEQVEKEVSQDIAKKLGQFKELAQETRIVTLTAEKVCAQANIDVFREMLDEKAIEGNILQSLEREVYTIKCDELHSVLDSLRVQIGLHKLHQFEDKESSFEQFPDSQEQIQREASQDEMAEWKQKLPQCDKVGGTSSECLEALQNIERKRIEEENNKLKEVIAYMEVEIGQFREKITGLECKLSQTQEEAQHQIKQLQQTQVIEMQTDALERPMRSRKRSQSMCATIDAAVEAEVNAVVEAFKITKEGMADIADRLTECFKKGLERDGEVVKMLITYVHSLPDGSEEGDFLALDFGGSIFRIVLVTIKMGYITEREEKYTIDDALKVSTQDKLFDFIAECISRFVKQHKITKKLPLAFTFSFPVLQTSLTSGTLIQWTKGFNASGAVGCDVVELLKEALGRTGDVEVDVVALVNDTTGTQMAIGLKDTNCHVGLILGTGTNACYMERMDAVEKFSGDRPKYPSVIISTEFGAFGDDGELNPWRTEFDKELDTDSLNPGKQICEKMTSYMYLGEIAKLAMQKLIKQEVLFEGKSCDKFHILETKQVAIIELGDNTECKKIFKDEYGIDASDVDCEVVRRVCDAVTKRAAQLAGAAVVAIVKKIGKMDRCTVAVDGSLYKRHPNFPAKMQEAMDELAPGNGITMKVSMDGSGRGAAVVAAVATRLKQAEQC